MGKGDAIDHNHFNCSEQHEEDFVAEQYLDEEGVRNFLKEKCKDGTFNYSTHDEVYKKLAEADFIKFP